MITESYGGYAITAIQQGHYWRYDIQPSRSHLLTIPILRSERYFPSAVEALNRAKSKVDYTLKIGHMISTMVQLTEGDDYEIADTGEIIFTSRGLQRSLDVVATGRQPAIYRGETLIWTAKE